MEAEGAHEIEPPHPMAGDEDGHEPAPRSVARMAERVRSRSAGFRCTLAAAGAWAITVAPLAASSRASVIGRILAALAILPGIAGPQLIARNNRMARHLGITTFLICVAAAWAWASNDRLLATVDLFRALLGVLAWGVFAVAWSHPWSVADVDLGKAPEGDTSGLKPRRRPPAFAVGVAALGVVGAFGCLTLGWGIDDPNRAVLAQAAAVGCAIALITSASTVAVIAGRDRSRERRPKLPINRRVVNSLVVMVLLLALAVALYFSR
jgi:hypothetical protein